MKAFSHPDKRYTVALNDVEKVVDVAPALQSLRRSIVIVHQGAKVEFWERKHSGKRVIDRYEFLIVLLNHQIASK
jgi:hypothetical protein